MGTSNPTRGKTFPSLKALFLNSVDPLSLSIAFSVCSHIKVLSVHLHPSSNEDAKEAIVALTMSLTRQANSLTAVRLFPPFQRQSLNNFLDAANLRLFAADISVVDHHAIQPSLWTPASLAIAETPTGPISVAAYIADRDMEDQKLLQMMPLLGVPGRPRKLLVSGRSQFHDMLAKHACAPAPSQRFDTVHRDSALTVQ